MDIIGHQERLIASGFKFEQAQEILRVVTSGDAQAMTKADGDRLEQRLTARIDNLEHRLEARFNAIEAKFTTVDSRFAALDAKFEAIDVKFEAFDTKIEAMTSKLVATVWTVGGAIVAMLAAMRYFG